MAERSDGNPDPFRALGAGSPLCKRADFHARSGCRIAGSIAHTFPASNYGLDIQIDTRIDRVESNLLAALQSVAALVWLGLVYALKGVLLLVEWAFSLDLLNEAMRPAARALDRLHHRVLGEPWFLAAITVAGLWGIWRGLVQMQTIRTVVGLAATVGLMLGALMVVSDPRGTVGHASRLANEGSLGLLSAASTGSTERPAASLAAAQERLFGALVVRPWCALQFGDVEWCLRKRGQGFAQADLWLAFPADGEERKGLYKLTKGEDPGSGGFLSRVGGAIKNIVEHGPNGLAQTLVELTTGGGDGSAKVAALRGAVAKSPERVRMQEQDGTFTRIALLALIAIGLLGAICLLLYLAIKLVLAGVLALMLLLLSPAMLLAPAFGETGREAFVTWAKRLVGAIAAKLIYALLLALVVVSATTLAALPIGWFGAWLLQAAFWWGILIKRHELLGFVSAGTAGDGERHGRSALLRAHQNARAAGALAAGAGAVAGALPARARRGYTAVQLGRREAGRRAVATEAASELDRSAERSRLVEIAEARRALAHRPDLERTRRALDRELAPFERDLARATATGRPPRAPTQQEREMLAKRDRIERLLNADDLGAAEQTIREADRAKGREGSVAGRMERAAWRDQRRRDIATGIPAEHERSLRAAAIDPRDYERADPPRKAELRARSQRAIDRDRDLLGAVAPQEGGQPTPREVAAASRHVDQDALRAARRAELARVRQERSARRARAHLHRRR